MSFAQSLGRTSMGVHEKYIEQTMQDFMAACEAQATDGYCHCQKSYGQPEWWSDGGTKTLEQRVRELGFSSAHACTCKHSGNFWIKLHASWNLESQAPEKTGPSGTSSTCPICHETRPAVALTPCGHVVCQQCQESQRFRQCPMCRTQVTGATRGLFM